jgi:hypothetical protein
VQLKGAVGIDGGAFHMKLIIYYAAQKFLAVIVCQFKNSYLYIKDAKSYFDEPRQDNLEVVKGIRTQGVHNILCATRKFVIIK